MARRGVARWGRVHSERGRPQKRKCASADLSLSFGHGRFQEKRGQPKQLTGLGCALSGGKNTSKKRLLAEKTVAEHGADNESCGVGLVKEPRPSI